MRTTIDLPDPLFKEAKSAAALRGQSLKEMVVVALRRELRHGRATPQAAAWKEYERLLERDEVVFLAEPNGLEIRWRDYTGLRVPAAKLWTDAYIAAFARGHGLRVVTFDQGFTRYAGTEVLVLTGVK